MKIAVAAVDDQVSMHFGRCKNFMVFETDNKRIVSSEIIPSPGHVHGLLPEFLGNLGVDAVISGGMGSGAMNLLRERGIEIITGASGLARTAVEAYLRGELKSSDAACEGHGHHHDGHGHHGSCSCGNH